jgi:hypothetical protein
MWYGMHKTPMQGNAEDMRVPSARQREQGIASAAPHLVAGRVLDGEDVEGHHDAIHRHQHRLTALVHLRSSMAACAHAGLPNRAHAGVTWQQLKPAPGCESPTSQISMLQTTAAALEGAWGPANGESCLVEIVVFPCVMHAASLLNKCVKRTSRMRRKSTAQARDAIDLCRAGSCWQGAPWSACDSEKMSPNASLTLNPKSGVPPPG